MSVSFVDLHNVSRQWRTVFNSIVKTDQKFLYWYKKNWYFVELGSIFVWNEKNGTAVHHYFW